MYRKFALPGSLVFSLNRTIQLIQSPVSLTDDGVKAAFERLIGVQNLYDENNFQLISYMEPGRSCSRAGTHLRQGLRGAGWRSRHRRRIHHGRMMAHGRRWVMGSVAPGGGSQGNDSISSVRT